MRILVTGANGFVGGALVARCLADSAQHVRGTVRSASSALPPGAERFVVGELSSETDWTAALTGVDVVVHTAARVHVMRDTSLDPMVEYRRVNVRGTLHLAGQAVAAGVKRFVFLSSIKVNGERTEPGRPFRSDDAPAAEDPYGVSKEEAEAGLRALAATARMEVVIIRPVLVYGPGVRANYRSMMRWLEIGVPLPFGAIRNTRSMVALENLVDLIVCSAAHPAAANRTFLVSDGEDLSTTELLRRTARALGRTARLVPVPAGLLSAALRAVGRGGLAQRLCDSLQVDIADTRSLLGWSPPVGLDEALEQTARDYRDSKSTAAP